MANRASDTDVLIVGAGPVGLFLANECARRGMRYRIVEAKATQSQYSKALAIFPRTMEIFDMAGIAAPFLEVANRVTSVTVSTHGQTLARMPFEPEESPYPFVAMVPQDVTERLLVDELRRKGGAVEYDTSFVSAQEQGDVVRISLERKGEPVELTASFVVGCDGAHSVVRHLLRLPFEGAEYEDSFILADIESNEALPANQLQLCPSESGPVAIFPMSATRRRLIAVIKKTEIEGEAPSLQLVRKVLAERAPQGLEARALHWSTYFRIHHRHVAQMRVGRMFIAGDAAHIHSPFGGQGMNTGLHDIWNLAWKLDLAVRGLSKDELLESYSTERLPVIKHVIETTHFLTKALGTPSKLAQLLRNTVIPMVSRLAPFQHAFVQRLSELGVAYGGSPIVEGAGKRFFEESLRGGGIGGRYLVMFDPSAGPAERGAAAEFCESFRNAVELRLRPGQKELVLVRPDGYVAYSAHGRALTPALPEIRNLLERQVHLEQNAQSKQPELTYTQ